MRSLKIILDIDLDSEFDGEEDKIIDNDDKNEDNDNIYNKIDLKLNKYVQIKQYARIVNFKILACFESIKDAIDSKIGIGLKQSTSTAELGSKKHGAEATGHVSGGDTPGVHVNKSRTGGEDTGTGLNGAD